MKNLKTFEYYSSLEKPNFKIGDWVICIDPNKFLKLHKKYKITNIELYHEEWYCYIEGFYQDFYCDRFIPEYEYNAKKYNI